MGSSILITGGSIEIREEYIDKLLNLVHKKEHPDILVINKEKNKKSIGIRQMREAIDFLIEKPYSSDKKVVIVKTADDMTIPAQNALLKTLEEPPLYAYIVLCSKTEKNLLETVKSRCKRLKIAIEEDTMKNSEGYGILPLERGIALDRVKVLSNNDSEDILEILDNWILIYREQLRATGQNKFAKNINLINDIKQDIETTNTNYKIALDYLALKLE